MQCISCDLGVTSKAGASSKAACRRCKSTESCILCPRNYYGFDSTGECFRCPEGTVSLKGASPILDCKTCCKNSFRALFDLTCWSCRPGALTSKPSAAHCLKPGHKCGLGNVPAGYRKNFIGDCISCTLGWRFSHRKKLCKPCPKRTLRELNKNGAKRVKCTGETNVDAQHQYCVCPPGHFTGFTCTKCGKGSFNPIRCRVLHIRRREFAHEEGLRHSSVSGVWRRRIVSAVM